MFSGLDSYTITLGICALLSALISLYTSVLESRDKRRKIFGQNIKTVKLVTSYCSFILTLLTLVAQNKHESDSKLSEIRKDQAADSVQHLRDSVQRDNLDTTLTRIDITIAKQKAALDSASSILNRQRTQLALSQAALRKQQQSLDSNTKIIAQEKAIFFGVNNNIALNQRTLDSVLKVYEQGKRNDNNLQQLTSAVNFGVGATLRIHTQNEDKLWKPGSILEGTIYHQMDNLDPFLENNIKPMSSNEKSDLRVFFNNLSPSFLDHQFFLNYELSAKKGQIIFEKPVTLDPQNFNALQVPFDIKYFPKEHVFQMQCGFNSANLLSNSGGIANFNVLVGHSKAYIIFKYRGRQHFELEGYAGRQKVLIDRFDIELNILTYGNIGQNQIRLTSLNRRVIINKNDIIKIVQPPVDEKELWRYQVIQIDINK
ncbi:hypothetical protein [Mucilaginibacter phyllosphaerae]